MAHLVYTSTYNVVFGGQIIQNGDESLPYLPLDKVSSCKLLIILIARGYMRDNNIIMWLNLFLPCDWSICGPCTD